MVWLDGKYKSIEVFACTNHLELPELLSHSRTLCFFIMRLALP